MATYTLPTFTNQLGTFTVVVESSVTGLTTPTVNTILRLSSGRESLELIPGTLNRSVSEVEVMDIEGFWVAALAGTAMIRVLLNEGSGNTFAFAGDVYRSSIVAEELYNDGTTKYRRIKIALKSLLDRLRNVTVTAVVEGIKSSGAEIEATNQTGWFTPVETIFAVAIEQAFSQAYLLTDAYLQCGSTTQDLVFNDGSSDLGFSQVYFQTQVNNETPPAEDYVYVGYMLSTHDDYWPDNYNNAYELIIALAENFGVIPRYDYDATNSKHRIQLLQRGRCFDSAVSLEDPIESSFTLDSYMIVLYASAYLFGEVGLGWYYSAGTFFSAPAPSWFEPHIEVICTFVVGYDISTYPTLNYHRLYSMATGDPVQIEIVKAWNYSTASQDTFSTGEAKLEKALLTYLIQRYRGVSQTTYQRLFPLMKPVGGSHVYTQPMCIVSVDSADHTAIECEKDFASGEVSLTLVKI